MKSKILLSTFLLFVFFLSSCGETSKETQEECDAVYPVNLDLGGLNVTENQSSFSVAGFDFAATGVASDQLFNGVVLAFGDGNGGPSVLELDLSALCNISTIFLTVENYCSSGCTTIETLDGTGNVLSVLNDETTIPMNNNGRGEVISIENIDPSVAMLRITSNEFVVNSIVIVDEETPLCGARFPISLDLDNLNVSETEAGFSLYDAEFKTVGVASDELFEGLFLAFGDGNNGPSELELDLTPWCDITAITLAVENYCGDGCTIIQTLNSNDEVIQEFNDNTTIPPYDPNGGVQEIRIENINASIAALRITSREFVVKSIRVQ